MFFKKRGQVWVETVIYTLIALVMMAAVLGYVRPKITEMQDKAIIESTIQAITEIDSQIGSIVQGGPGNSRKIEIGIKKGSIKIDGENEKIIFELESTYTYSDPGKEISVGNIKALTTKKGKFNEITLTREYSNYDLKFEEAQIVKTLNKASTPYVLLMTNKGTDSETTKMIIDFKTI